MAIHGNQMLAQGMDADECPSEIALYAYNYLKYSRKYSDSKKLYILDTGCGDGRDSAFLASNLSCYILGVDFSETLISRAQSRLNKDLSRRVEFLYYDYRKILDKFDVILSCNQYNSLRKQERSEFRKTVKNCLNANGTLFLSTLSINDPLYKGQIAGEKDEQYIRAGGSYLHLSKREELEKEFDFLKISALFEREYYQNDDQVKRKRLAWFLMGENV